MNNFVIDTPDNFWQIRWLDKYMEGHKGFIAGGCFKNILSGERVKDIDIFFESELVIDENIPFPVSTWERSYRYKGYGYNMCRETKKKLLQAIKGVNVEEEDVSLYTTGGWD